MSLGNFGIVLIANIFTLSITWDSSGLEVKQQDISDASKGYKRRKRNTTAHAKTKNCRRTSAASASSPSSPPSSSSSSSERPSIFYTTHVTCSNYWMQWTGGGRKKYAARLNSDRFELRRKSVVQLLDVAVWLTFLVYKGPRMKLGSCCIEQAKCRSTIQLWVLWLERFCCSLLATFTCLWNSEPDN